MNNKGQGLQSLIPPKQTRSTSGASNMDKSGEEEKGEQILLIPREKIKPNPRQPRKKFSEEKLKELASSIKEHGILQPLVVSKKDDHYQLIAGQRRLKAAELAGIKQLPVIVRKASDQQNLELALVENVQRDNLNPIEKAYAYEQLINEFNFNQQDVSKRVGKSREVVANSLRLLKLPAQIQRAIAEGEITEGHGRVILTLASKDKQLLLLDKILKNKLSVRETENFINQRAKSLSKKSISKSRKTPHLKSLEKKLSDFLSARVKVTQKGSRGKMTISFFSKQELNELVKKICKK